MKLLVVTPTLGRSCWLDEAVASVALAAPFARHVLVCPAETADELRRRFPGAEITVETQRGLYAALNCGVAGGAEVEAFTWLNDDDVFRPAGFAVGWTALGADAGIDAIFGEVDLIGGRGNPVGRLPVARCGRDLAALLARGIVPLAQPGTIIRREWWEKLGGFDASFQLAGDLDFFVRAIVAGARFEFARARVAAFRLSAGQLSKHREQGDAELRRALAPLAAAPRSLAALGRFRRDNLGVYLERLRRHGWVSMRDLYDRTE